MSPGGEDKESFASTPAVRRRMVAQRRRDTAAEMSLRRELHRRGRRYRVDVAPVPSIRSRADILFTRASVAVFVDGCFWHRCPIHGTVSKTNADYWSTKLATNVARDLETTRRLEDAGWTVVRVWEHENVADAADRVEAALDSSGPRGGESAA